MRIFQIKYILLSFNTSSLFRDAMDLQPLSQSSLFKNLRMPSTQNQNKTDPFFICSVFNFKLLFNVSSTARVFPVSYIAPDSARVM